MWQGAAQMPEVFESMHERHRLHRSGVGRHVAVHLHGFVYLDTGAGGNIDSKEGHHGDMPSCTI